MATTELIGHRAVEQYLAKVEAVGRLGHAYLLSGPAHVGKSTVALRLVARLLCTNTSKTGSACGACSACRQVASHAHPDLVWLQPAEGKTAVTIDQVRELISFTQLRALGGGFRAVVIENVALLTPEAANALLKVLEEPPQGVVFCLLDHQESPLLPTLRSRCTLLTFGLVSTAEIEQALETRSAPAAVASELARQAAGRPGLAISLLVELSEVDRKYEVAQEFIALFKPGSWAGLQRWFEAELVTRRGSEAANLELPAVLAIWLEVARDVLLLRLGLTTIRYQKLQPELQLLAEQQTVVSALARCRAIGQALTKLVHNANARLTFEWLAVTLPRL